jgi:hypothetical protein
VRRDMGMGRRASDNRHACNHRRLGASTEARLAWPSSQVNPATFAGRAVRHILVSCRTEPRYARPHSLAKKETTAPQVHCRCRCYKRLNPSPAATERATKGGVMPMMAAIM